MGSNEWVSLFPSSKVIHLECGILDHNHVVIYPLGIPLRHQKPWRFEHVWLKEEGCHETVASVWQKNFLSSPMQKVEEKIKLCQTMLQWWSRVYYGNTSQTLNEKKRQMKQPKQIATGGGQSNQVFQLKGEICELLAKEEKL